MAGTCAAAAAAAKGRIDHEAAAVIRDVSGFNGRTCFSGAEAATAGKVGVKLVGEELIGVFQRTVNTLAKSAEAGHADHFGDLEKEMKTVFPQTPLQEGMHQFHDAARAFPAGNAFAAEIRLRKIQEAADCIHDAAVFVQNGDDTVTPAEAERGKRFCVQYKIQLIRAQKRAGRPANLYGLEGLAARHASGCFDHLTDRRGAFRHFDRTGRGYITFYQVFFNHCCSTFHVFFAASRF